VNDEIRIGTAPGNSTALQEVLLLRPLKRFDRNPFYRNSNTFPVCTWLPIAVLFGYRHKIWASGDRIVSVRHKAFLIINSVYYVGIEPPAIELLTRRHSVDMILHMTIAFSYIRFSSAKQELGDSLRRQQRKAEEYAAKHGLQLDSQSYQDLGISAFRGQNAAQGNLSKFLEAVESGKIARGSFLLVESLDRLSRNDVDVALQMFLRIIGAGITVVTLIDEQSYSWT
jgi:hypothetical protein